MKPLFRIILVLAIVFASTVIIIRLPGVFAEDHIKVWLKAATNINPLMCSLAVVLIFKLLQFVSPLGGKFAAFFGLRSTFLKSFTFKFYSLAL